MLPMKICTVVESLPPLHSAGKNFKLNAIKIFNLGMKVGGFAAVKHTSVVLSSLVEVHIANSYYIVEARSKAWCRYQNAAAAQKLKRSQLHSTQMQNGKARGGRNTSSFPRQMKQKLLACTY